MNEIMNSLSQAFGTAWAYYLSFAILVIWAVLYRIVRK